MKNDDDFFFAGMWTPALHNNPDLLCYVACPTTLMLPGDRSRGRGLREQEWSVWGEVP